MITFQGNKEILKSAHILESRTRNTYPHISTSKIRRHIGYETEDHVFFIKMKKAYAARRKIMYESGDYYTSVIDSLLHGRIGNCAEDALFAELLGKLNGQKNIYSGNLGLYNGDKRTGYLNHTIAFITDEPVKSGKDFLCKNKEAVIIDPWLGITDFAGNYFNKLRTNFRKVFMYEKDKRFVTLPDDNPETEFLREISGTPEEYNKMRKEFLPSIQFCILPFINDSLNSEKLNIIRYAFPELTIKNYKTVALDSTKHNPTGHIA